LRIWLAKAAEPPGGFHALFKCYEAAICTAADRSTTVIRAPRIVLGFGACSKSNDADAYDRCRENENASHWKALLRLIAQHPPHFMERLSLNPATEYDFNQETEARRIAANVAKLPELLRKP